MDKQAFKQRMQNLKSYRENNPGKGYWDWRNSLPDNLKYTDDTEYNMRGAYESGAQPILENDGFYHLPTRNPQTGEILKTSLHPTFWKGLAEDAKLGYNTYFVGDKVYTKSKEEGPINVYADGGEVARKSLKDIRKKSTIGDKLDYNVMLQNQNTYQKEFATNWYKERAKNTKYRSQLGDGKLDKILSDIDKATWKNPTEAMKDNLISQGYTPTEQNIKSQLQAINAKGTKGFAVPSMYSYYGAPRNTWHEGIGHIVGDNNPAILDSTPNISIPSNDPQYSDYINQANEKHAQTWDFRGKNQTLKDDTGNYYIDPNRQLSSDDIQEMIDKGAVIPDQWKDITTQDISDLTNTFAYNYAEGGEVGNPNDDFTKAINIKLGRTSDGRPKEQGLKPVIDLKDAANITPIGDALSARDVYNAVTEKDWTGAGLAAATMIPFVPMTVKQFRKKYKGITPKSKQNYNSKLMDKTVQSYIDNADSYKESRIKLYEEAIKDRNKEYDNWIENEDAFRRAANFDRKYGTNYVRTYSDELKRKYQNSNDITQIGIKPMDPDTYGSFDPAIPDYIFISNNQIVNKKPRVGLINHELGHRIDRQAGVFGSDGKVVRPIFNRDKFESSDRIKQMYPKTYNKIQNYLLKDSEIKSHMNEFRTYLRENNLLDPTGKESLNSFKKKLFNSNFDNLKKIFNSYKSGKQFIDDFNMIPITATNNNSDSILV